MCNKRGFWLIVMMLLLQRQSIAFGYEVITIYTPHHTSVQALLLEEFSTNAEIQERNNTRRKAYPEAEFIGNSSQTYNCHAYAWHVSEGGSFVWINDPEEDKYWDPADGSYLAVPESQATKVSYVSDDHSAILTEQPGWVISKWGPNPLMRHPKAHCPYDSSVLRYYAPASLPAPPFAASYGDAGTDTATAMQLTHDGGYVVAGTTTSFGASNTDAWLLKVAGNGAIPAPNSTTHTAGGWQRRGVIDFPSEQA